MRLKLRTSTVVTFIMVLAFGGLMVAQRMQSAANPPVVERKVEVTTPHGIAPVPEFLLRHKEELSLTAAQEGRLAQLAAAYRKDIAPVQRQLGDAVKGYQQYMEHARKGGPRPDAQKLQAQGGDVQHLSSVIAAARQAYWARAREILTEAQRRQADALVNTVTIRDLQ